MLTHEMAALQLGVPKESSLKPIYAPFDSQTDELWSSSHGFGDGLEGRWIELEGGWIWPDLAGFGRIWPVAQIAHNL